MRELSGLITSCPWFVDVLTAVRESGLPDAWVGAGVVRDLVWGRKYGHGFQPAEVRDVDVAFLGPSHLTDAAATETLRRLRPGIPWEATNQSLVHVWYGDIFGTAPVEPLRTIADAVATWPETATCVAVRLDQAGTVQICAPLGLDDLLNGVWRHNPRRATLQVSLARLARHQPQVRWPGVRIVPPDRPA